MRNLLNFFFKNGYWFLFIFLEVVCFILLFRFNNYQGSVVFTSANRFASYVYNFSAEVSSYFKLGSINTTLTRENFDLQVENQLLRKQLKQMMSDSSFNKLTTSLSSQHYQIIPARIINNSINKPDNYITLNKGKADGVEAEMGVVTGNGIIGIVYMISEHYSLAISLLNSKSSISCKFKHNDYFGYLKWRGDDPQFAFLEDLPRHALFKQGDTIVTSGHSAVFPQGLMVGTVDSIADSKDGLSYLLKIRLAADFACMDNALIISDKKRLEQQELESFIVNKP